MPGSNTRDSGPNSGTKVYKHQNGILNANIDLKIRSDVHYSTGGKPRNYHEIVLT